MADRIGLKGSDRTKYIHEHMTRGGYRAVPQYVKDEDGDGDDDSGSGFFGKRQRSSRDGGDSGKRRRREDDDWYQ
jgi:hypothetical protein